LSVKPCPTDQSTGHVEIEWITGHMEIWGSEMPR